VFPGTNGAATPDKPAVIMAGSGEVVTHKQLDDRSNQLAQYWHAQGLRPGDHVAVFMENHPRYLEVVWAGLRSGLYVTPVNSHLNAEEVSYVLADSSARSVVSTPAMAPVLKEALANTPGVNLPLVVDGGAAGLPSYEATLAARPAEPLTEQPAGDLMLYSSGTTGRPKGIERPLSGRRIDEGQMLSGLLVGVFGFDSESVYLSPAPAYHTAPLGFSLAVTSLGATVVMMERFDPIGALAAIEKYRVTCSQWVPTMFARMFKLPGDKRSKHDTSSLKIAIHAAAPCPIELKKAMLDWWGPIIWEFYGGTEANGLCLVSPQDWLARPGTVGKPVLGEVHIVDDDGHELRPGEVGTVYFGGAPAFEYHNDPEKTQRSRDPGGHGWTTLGDVGYLDEDGWLFLTDRQAFMIISGGVNIYPQEAENVLTMHPAVADVAVIGIPNDEMGEEVKAVVQPLDLKRAGPELEQELLSYCRARLAHYKCPTTIDFEEALPRLPTGKLYKRLLRQRYWDDHPTKVL
jgi:long-chain acyl-CoA synthetase